MILKRSVAAVAVAVIIGVAGCGGASPTSEKSNGSSSADSGAKTALQKVYKQVEGLEGQARLKKLAELAAEEDTNVGLYTSMNLEDSTPLTEDFTDKYDIDVDLYRASSSDVLARLIEEAKAGFTGADVVAMNGPEMQIMDDKGMLLPLESPTREDIYEGARYETWLGIYMNTFATSWNTDKLKQAPKSWEQVLTGYGGSLAMEVGDWDWFTTLTRDYFMKEKGMSKKEAVDLFGQGLSKATLVDGHTTMSELLAAGEFDLSSSVYQHTSVQQVHDGAPIAWEPAVEPLVMRPNGIGILSNTDAPATALLFTEYGITEGQKVIANLFRTPANERYGGLNNINAITKKYDVINADLDYLNQHRDEWEKLYEQLAESGGKVIEGE